MNTKKLRKDMIKYIYEMGTLKWTPSRDIIGERFPQKNYAMIYYKGKTYYGPPYSKYNIIMYEDFKAGVKSGVYQIPDFTYRIPSMNCAGPYLSFFSKYMSVPVNFAFADFILDAKYFQPVGDIRVDKNTFLNYQLSSVFPEQQFYNCYKQLQMGDFFGFVFREHAMRGLWGHMCMVSGNVHVEENPDGTINGVNSYVFIIEFGRLLSQTHDSNFYGGLVKSEDYVVSYKQNKKLTDISTLSDLKDKTTHFQFNRKLTFKELYHNGYLPFRSVLFL